MSYESDYQPPRSIDHSLGARVPSTFHTARKLYLRAAKQQAGASASPVTHGSVDPFSEYQIQKAPLYSTGTVLIEEIKKKINTGANFLCMCGDQLSDLSRTFDLAGSYESAWGGGGLLFVNILCPFLGRSWLDQQCS